MKAFHERNILMRVHHPFIIKLFGSFQTENRFHLVLDYLPGGQLRKHLNNVVKFPINQIRLYLAEITLALKHLHKFRVVYNNLRPENILLTETGHIQLSDFSNSADAINSDAELEILSYSPPEILQGFPYDTRSDWWSLGIVAYELATGKTPYKSARREDLIEEIFTQQIQFPCGFDDELLSLIRGLLIRDPTIRYDDKNIKDHQLFSSIDWEMLSEFGYVMDFFPPIDDRDDSEPSKVDSLYLTKISIFLRNFSD